MNSYQSSQGWVARFSGPESLLRAAQRFHELGCRELETYTPYPVEELEEISAPAHSRVPAICLLGGILGGLGGYGLEYWVNVSAYPLDIGGQPHNSWPAFIPITFECSVLGAALFALVALLWRARLLRYYHPIFTTPLGEEISKGAFVLFVSARESGFDSSRVPGEMKTLGALNIEEINAEEMNA
jgi:hypothetical protein